VLHGDTSSNVGKRRMGGRVFDQTAEAENGGGGRGEQHKRGGVASPPTVLELLRAEVLVLALD
jgi:hypothetical protein